MDLRSAFDRQVLNRLLAGLERVQNELTPDELLGLFAPAAHLPLLKVRRATVILCRVRAVAVFFAVLTPLWIVVDALILPLPLWFMLAAARLVATAAFVLLARFCKGKNGIEDAQRALACVMGIPIAFFAFSQFLSVGYPAGDAVEALTTGYAFLPFVILAGLSVFPLTAVEGAALAFPVLLIQLAVGLLHVRGFSWASYFAMLWLLVLISGVSTLAAMSQLGVMMALVRQATRDDLTGCFTRRSGEELLNIHLHNAQRHGMRLVVVFIDLDDFKEINDTFGHEAGDQVLARFARGVRGSLRDEDVLVRWGGEEFVLMLPNTGWTAAKGVVERLCASGLGLRPDGRPVTASFGIAECPGDGAIDWKRLVDVADRRMYRAKQAGKDRYIGCDDELSATVLTARQFG